MRFNFILGFTLLGSVAANLLTFETSFSAIEKSSVDFGLGCKKWNGTHDGLLPILAELRELIEVIEEETFSCSLSEKLLIADAVKLLTEVPAYTEALIDALLLCIGKKKFFLELIAEEILLLSFTGLKAQVDNFSFTVSSKLPTIERSPFATKVEPLNSMLSSTLSQFTAGFKAKRSEESSSRNGRMNRIKTAADKKEANKKLKEVQARRIEQEAQGQRERRVRRATDDVVKWE